MELLAKVVNLLGPGT